MPMKGRDDPAANWAVLILVFFFGLLAFCWPFLAQKNFRSLPLLYVHTMAVWALFVALLFGISRVGREKG